MKITLNSNDKASFLNSINFDLVRSALVERDFESLCRVFEYLKTSDAQISSELFKRRVYACALPLFFESENKEQNDFIGEFLQSAVFKRLFFDLSAGLAYGFSGFVKNFKNENGKILPEFSFISPMYFNTDKDGQIYLKQGIDKIYPSKNDLLWVHFHPTDSGEIIDSSLMYKVVVISALKHIALSKYMSFLDSLSVPPLVIKSDAISDEKQSEALISAAVNLRANGVGLFSKDDLIELLNGGVDRATFLDFVKYCDESVSKLITGQILAGNSQQNGTQALGKIHNEIRQDILRFDALLLQSSLHTLIDEILRLNFAVPAPYKFNLDANQEADEDKLSVVYERIANMGYEIPAEFIEETFKIKGLKPKRRFNDFQNNSRGAVNLGDEFELALGGAKFSQIEKSANKSVKNALNDILKDCQSYEEAFNKLAAAFPSMDFHILEDAFTKAVANAQIYGSEDD